MSARQPIDLPIDQVTVLEDRAQITRAGELSLPAGRSLLLVTGIAPILADKTLQARVTAGQGEVVDARVRRAARVREEDRPARHAEREATRRQLRTTRRRLQARAERRASELSQLEQAEALLLGDITEDAAWGRTDGDRWLADLEKLRERSAQQRTERLDLEDQVIELDRRLADLDALVASLEGPDVRLGACVELDLDVATAGSVQLRLTYVVPGACWRPLHRATLERASDGGPDQLQLETYGCVWQLTGEDWTGAQLSLSTQRASLGAEPPLLSEDLLHTRPRQEQVTVEVREQAIETSGLGTGTAAAQGLPGIDDGGEVRNLRVQGRPQVPSDGRPHRLPLSHFSTPASVELVAMPERAAAVITRVRADNAGSGPLLAGPTELVTAGGRVGRTTMKYVAQGERFELGFGPDPGLRIHRVAERVDHEPGVLTRWASTDHEVRLRLSNLGSEARTLSLTERIPVSEVEQVRVELKQDQTSAGATADKDGMVRWTLTLGPGDTAERVLAWRVEKKKRVAGL